jgi:hypothetical protein
MLPQKRERRHVPSKDLLGFGVETESHQRAVVGRVRLDDANKGDARTLEALRLAMQGELVGDGQNDRVSALGKVSRARFSGSVDEVRSLNSPWEICANNDVVAARTERSGAIPRTSWSSC